MMAAVAGRAASAPDFADLAAQVAPAVVNISVYAADDATAPHQDDDSEPAGFTTASGVVIAADGYILTSAAAIAGADTLIVRLADGRRYPAALVGADRGSDLALLKIKAQDLPTATLGDSSAVRPGQWVAAIGLPSGLDNTVTVGVISALHRHLASRPYIPYIQTDTPINAGSVGGPLLNLAGEVVGISSAVQSEMDGGYVGVSFAVPSNLATNVVRQLEVRGSVSRGWLGVNVGSVSPERARATGMIRPSGALVNTITAGSPAAQAGLKIGDIIIGLGGRRVSGPTDLPPLVGPIPAGHQTSMTVLRSGKRQQIDVTIGLLARDSGSGAGRGNRLDRLGMSVSNLSAEQRRRLGVPAGVMVEHVAADGAARHAGISSGDIVIRIKAAQANNVAQLDALEQALKPHELVPILVQHERETRFVAVEVPPHHL